MAWTDKRAAFLVPHPDDELVAFGPAIPNHIAAGREVHVVSITGGGASGILDTLNGVGAINPWWGVAHNPTVEGYAPLDVEAFKQARRNELRGSCAALGVRPENIHIYDLPDGGVQVADVEAILRADFAWPGASFKTTSYRNDRSEHPDHRAIGQALKNVHDSDPTVWGDARWYVFSRALWPAADPAPETNYETPANATVRLRVLNGCRAYSGWAPALGHFAVGYQSVGLSHFAQLEADVRAMVQTS